MTSNKMTKKDFFNELLNYVPADKVELCNFIHHELDILAKKNTNSKTAIESAEKNAAVSEKLLEIMANKPDPLTISELTHFIGNPDVSTQRVAVVMASLVSAGKAIRSEDGRKARFKLAE